MPDLLGDFSFTWPFYAAALIAYLLGSIPFGLVLTKMAGLGDIRDIGSGSIGATNVLRTGRKSLAAATMALDIAKGAVAVLLAGMYGPDMAVIAGGAVILGHCFPVWLKFNGGKGVATGAGIVLAINLQVGLACFAIWLVMLLVFRYSSLAAITAVLASPFLTYHFSNQQHAELVAFMAALILLRHHQNMKRLVLGEESKVSFSRKKKDIDPASADPASDEETSGKE